MTRNLIVLCGLLFILAGTKLYSQNKNSLTPESAKLLSNYVKYASISGSEKEAGSFFLNECKKKGLHIRMFNNDEDSFNFSASLYPLTAGKPNIIFLNHIDVVSATDSSKTWIHPPFSGTIKNDAVWGRGAIDNKSMAIMQLLALEQFIKLSQEKDLGYNVSILSVSSEENGGLLGSKLVADNHFELLNPILVLGEGGTGVSDIPIANPDENVFGISIAQKNRLWLQLELKTATAGHGAVPPEEYSNQLMVRSLNRLIERKPRIIITEPAELMFEEIGKLKKGMKGFALRHIRMFKPFLRFFLKKDELILRSLLSNTVTITRIANPIKSSNQIPQSILVNLDCRLLPGINVNRFVKSIAHDLNNEEITITIKSVVNEDVGFSDTRNIYFKSLKNSIAKIYPGAKTIPILFPASNDNEFFRARGVICYGLLPVLLNSELLNTIHNSNERMPVAELEKGIRVYSAFLADMLKQNPSAEMSQIKLKD